MLHRSIRDLLIQIFLRTFDTSRLYLSFTFGAKAAFPKELLGRKGLQGQTVQSLCMQKVLGAETKSLIEALHEPVSFWESAAKHKISTLALISQTGDPAAIPDIVLLLLDGNRVVSRSAVAAVSRLTRLLNPAELPWLDLVMRERSPYRWSYPSAWAELKPDQLHLLERFGKESVSSLGMASLHFSGYVRDEALRKLTDAQDGAELPFLLLRLNDWVQEVRRTAHLLVRERLTTKYAPFFVSNIALVNRLRLVRRGQQGEIVGAIERLLKSKDCQEAVEIGLRSPDWHVKRACYELAFESASFDQLPLIERALSEKDPAVRLRGAEKISILPHVESVDDLLSRARDDRFAPVRRTALRVFSERFPERSRPWLERALTDSDPSLRSYAQFQLGRASDFDLRAFYQAVLGKSEPATLYAAISGLGETGISSDANLVMAHLSHRVSRVRRAVLRTLARLHAEEFVDLFAERLLDHAPSVSREAMRGLTKVLHLVPGERLWRIFAAATEDHVRRNALFLIARLSKWESIGYLVEALDSNAEELRKLAETYLRRWHAQFNSSFTAPTKPQVERLTVAMQRSGASLDRSIRGQIEFGIRSF
jgi:HEAT repeat protein